MNDFNKRKQQLEEEIRLNKLRYDMLKFGFAIGITFVTIAFMVFVVNFF